ncbi:MAG: hypothetical protein KC506_01245 [Nanoarchaeota archaeon]|nr:hypothetical protein [Nanoarchaeota archaeon]
MLNKKAQIAEGVLEIVALVLGGLIIFVMLTIGGGIEKESREFAELSSQTSFNEQHALAETKLLVKTAVESCNFCTDPEELTWSLHLAAQEQEKFIATESLGNLFGRLRNVADFYLFLNSEGKYQLEIKDIFVKTEIENNKITRTFNICQTFDKKGNYLEDCEIQILK